MCGSSVLMGGSRAPASRIVADGAGQAVCAIPSEPVQGQIILPLPLSVGTQTYSLACTSADGMSRTANATLTVLPAPTTTLRANPSTILLGKSATLSWSRTNVLSRSDWTGAPIPLSGSEVVTPTTGGQVNYENYCNKGSGRNIGATAIVNVNMATVTVRIKARPSVISLGQPTTLTWTSSGAQSCTASQAWSGTEPTRGSLVITPDSAGGKAYTITCFNANGITSAEADATVEVRRP